MEADRELEPLDTVRLRRLTTAIDALAIDSVFFVDALTEELEALRPYRAVELPDDEKRFIIENGGWTSEEFEEIGRDLARGKLHVRAMTSWVAPLLQTVSIRDAAGLLDLDESAVVEQVNAGRINGITVSGTLRIPVWQFTYRRPQSLLPGLPQVIAAMRAESWDWRRIGSFMAVPQNELFGQGAQTPAQWLMQGGEVETVVQLVEESAFI